MSESRHETIMWIRHDGDAGLWWPGVYQGTDARNSSVVKGIRDFDDPRSFSRDRPRGESPSSNDRRFWVPFYGLLVEATQCRAYCSEMPTPAGPDKCYEYKEAAKLQMDERIQQRVAGQDLDATAPLSPPSPLEGAYSTANRETPVASYLLCPSSGGNASQESPALSVSSTVTEREATPLEPITGLRVNAPASITLTAGGNDSEREQGVEERKTACGMGPCVAADVCSPQSGAKRSWAQTSPGQQQQQQRPRNSEGVGFPGANVERAQETSPRGACPADIASPGRNTIFSKSSQFPRLGGPPTPHGPNFCRAQGSKPDLADAGLETGRHDAHGGLFDGVAGSTEGSCGEYLHQETSEESEAVDSIRAGGPKQAGLETLPAQQSMDVCEMELAADAVASTDRDASTPPGEAAPTPVVVALPLQSEQRCSEHVPVTTSLPADEDAEEAAVFRQAEITGNEPFKRLSSKLQKLGWRWGGQVGSLSDDTWFLKPGATTKTAQAGVGKFETWDDVVRYVQKVLGAQGATTPDSEGSEVASQTGSDSLDASDDEIVALPLQSEQRHSEHVPVTTSLPANEDAEEAAVFRKAEITGNEPFKRLSSMLQTLGWRWGGQVGSLSDDTWFLKPGATTKTAQAGVGKFETWDDVVRYVQKVLGAQGATTPDSEGSEVASQAGSDSEDESDGDLLGEEGRVEEEQGTPEPAEGEREGQALQTALEALHPSKAPGVMKQRATEFKRVLQFVVSSATDPSGGSLYLCGCPGTGKTQTMAHVQAEVRRVAAKGAFPTPAFHAFTGTAFTDPNAMHSALWRAVTGGMDVPTNIEKALSAKLKRQRKPTASSPMIVVVLDEIDQLMSRSRHVLRKLFEWADAPKSRLVLVGIANSIEFDVGFSSLNTPPEKVLFQAYTPEDLMSILTERVGAVVHKPAVQLCSKKIAATHGDARRAISLCREAVVLAKRELQDKLDSAGSQKEQESVGHQEGVALVTIRHMSMALSAGRVSRYADAITALSIQAQIVLSVAAAAVYGVSGQRGDQIHGAKAGKRAPLTQGDLHEKCMSVWGRLRTGGGLSQIEFSGTIDMLAAQGLLKLKGKQLSGGRARQLVLLIEFSDVEIALGGHPFFKAAVSI